MRRTMLQVLAASTILTVGWAASAHAQAVGAAPADAAHTADEEIVVVGSSLRVTEAKIARGTTPVQIVSAEEMQLSGQKAVADLVRTQPVFSGTSASAEGQGLGRSTLNLRGVGDQYTLSLVNGRRFAVNGAANVGIIPESAIERIEVLTSGASAIYGSDAVAGVVNIVLRKDADGVGGSVRYGEGTARLAERQVSAYIGSRGDNGGFILSVDHFERKGLRGKELPTGTNNLARFGGIDFRSDATNPGRIILPNGDNVILNTDLFGPGTFSNNPASYRPFVYDRDAHDRWDGGIYAISPTKRTSLMFSGHRDLGPDTKLSLDVIANRTKDRYLTGSSVALIDVPANNPYNPFGVPASVAYRFSDYADGPYNRGIGAIQAYRIDTLSSALTLEHSFSDKLRLSATANYFREESHLRIPNAYSAAGLAAAIARTGPDAFNAFCNRCNNDAQFQGVLVGTYNDQTSELIDFDTRLTGSLMELGGGDLAFAVGAGYRHESYEVRPDQQLAQGLLIDQGLVSAQSLSRKVTSVFAELRAPVLEGLELQAAARYEHYSDFGGTFNPLVAAKWEAVPDQLIVRASYSTSFRAPFLQDLTSERTSSQVPVFDPVRNATVNAAAITGGNPNLDSEDAKTFSAGVVMTPEFARGLQVTIDWFRLKQNNLVIAPSPQSVIAGLAPGTVTRGPNVGGAGRDTLIEALKTNGANRTISGIDFAATYRTEFSDKGVLTLDLAGTRLLDFKVDMRDGSGLVEQAGSYSPLFGGLPKWKLVAGPTVKYGWFTTNLKVRHAGGYTDPDFFGIPPRKVGSVNYIDIAARIDLGDDGLALIPGGEFTIGATNLTNKLPPFVRSASLFFGDGAAWDRGNFDISGRFVYASLGVRF
ncbi:TonB-dependent receptor [Rhizorhabdus wittichii DC-6]|uniref:TonB-dependent receptor n=1 Tax=Rhizorhabdus wittichii (strain DSM 6014 / CCUG 31198 / JCM 15750 / NBRC 105917 / EY 4224 / RW1) TaxID=392499 RepID=A0A9J9HDD9_RHIWR|nr:TonB-dependent receptor [Rhizorhabdus wittichii RW1]ARR53805.1 TonB-dependent receptor [Rhizorhabdus wittichii DC-6]